MYLMKWEYIFATSWVFISSMFEHFQAQYNDVNEIWLLPSGRQGEIKDAVS